MTGRLPKSAEWHARIEVGGGVAGAGFLITPDTVLTCAHVVQQAAEGTIAVTFTERPGTPAVPARVVVHGGWAGGPTDLGDLAVLELERPAPVAPAVPALLDTADGTRPHKLVVYGFPAGFPEGTLAEYRVTAPQLISGEWMQLEAWQPDGQPLAPGFSGAAVTLVDTGEVVGMVTAAGARGVRNGRMMPTHVMARYWPGLKDLIAAGRRPPAARRDWLDAVTGSLAWSLVKPADQDTAESLKAQARDVVARLAESYGTAHGRIAEDPWHDRNLALRIAYRTNQLIRILWSESGPGLEGAEAALLTLLPFLYQAHRTGKAAGLAAEVEPARLAEAADASPVRQQYDMLLRGHHRLVRQARRGPLHGHPDCEREVGWWLFHQWTNRQPGTLDRLLAVACRDDVDIRRVLHPELVTRLVSCVGVPPGELFDTTRDGHLRAEAFQLNLRGLHFPKVRERLLGSLFAIAHRMAIEVTDLPAVVVEHAGIPYALSPAQVLGAVEEEQSSWSDQRDALRLKAVCDHPALVDALTEHAQRMETLLRHVRHAAVPGLDALPAYAGASELRSSDGNGTPGPVNGVIRFRLDEARVQELLMGENLYRDRSLAIRELYQNALDACRYRAARTRAGDPHSSYRGLIEFTQGVEDGRHYLECRDNGIGMDETVLAQAFSQAGVRFTDLPDFREEQQEWRRHGITMHPTSRFGIGVLSYFMLADEIHVTTRRMDSRGELTVVLTGPGHYFRVRASDVSQRGPGTRVRLYLRAGDKAPSCVRELGRLLGIAEFTTVARHGSQEARWEAGELRPREAPRLRPDGFDAHGSLIAWPNGPGGTDGQVVWCEHGGGILVDGIHVEPRVRQGVLSDPANRRQLRGVVVNLSGRSLPRRLSTDRTEILDADVCEQVEQLIGAALPALVGRRAVRDEREEPWLTSEWLADVAGVSPRLADLVTDAAGRHGCVLELHGRPAPLDRAGFFPQDVHIVHRARSGITETGASLGETPAGKVYDDPDDVTRLWRLLGHRPNAELAALTALVPELDRVGDVLAARPSDVLARSSYFQAWDNRLWPRDEDDVRELGTPGHALFVATVCGRSYSDVVARLRRLRLTAPEPSGAEPLVDSVNLALLSDDLRALNRDDFTLTWLPVDEPVPPGHLLQAHQVLGVDATEAASRMRTFGFEVVGEPFRPDPQDRTTLVLLSRRRDGEFPWLRPAEPVQTGWILAAAEELGLPVPEVARRLRRHRLDVRLGAGHEDIVPGLLAQGRTWGWHVADLAEMDDGTVPPGALADTAVQRGLPLQDVARRITELGFAVPAALPPSADHDDLVILRRDGEEAGPWIPAGAEVTLLHVAQVSDLTGLSPAAVASRLRSYGLVPPDAPLPEVAGTDNVVLVVEDLDRPEESAYAPGDRVTARHVITVADRLRITPREVLDLLAGFGLWAPVPSDTVLPDHFDAGLAFTRSDNSESGPLWLDWDRTVPPYHLLSVSAELELDPDELVEELAAFGFRMPDHLPGQWDRTDRRLCLELREEHSAPLSLPHAFRRPVAGFLHVSRLAGLPDDELVARLTRLGIDLRPVADAVRAALPRVPGLEWRDDAPDG
ncbi:trypsin-like peptidase domain-containing protein [Streptomyces sp. NPDC088387]|uniref:wHTH domain-containing protein n=1 Tax=Streptomyces sp. NPDC088387 TaxID=3365859 RepID=UPI0038275CE7